MTPLPIPARVDEITVDWFNAAVAASSPGVFAPVTAVSIEHFADGVGILGELARLSLTYADGASGPETVVAKCASPLPENQFLGVAMGFYLREINFYREVADRVDITVPRPYHAAADPSGVPFVLLIEDVVGATTPDQLGGISAEQADRIIGTIVPLHAQFWGRTDELDRMAWLPPMNNEMYKGGQAMADARFPEFADHFGARLDAASLGEIERVCARYIELLDHSAAVGAPTFTHTDCRAENYLFGGPRGDDAVTVIDFQLSTRHIGMWDVANLVAGSMTTDDRRRHERDLVAGYVDRVVAGGIDYSLEQALHEYRLCLLHQTVAQVITSDLGGGNERGDALLEQLHLRPVTAAVDNEVFDLLGTF